MTTDDVVATMANKWLPLTAEGFFTMQRADDMWFGDELPPTHQAAMRSPLVTQAKVMAAQHIYQTLAMAQRRREAQAIAENRKHAVARVGKRVKSSRRN